jgi:hypothetical protein
MIDSSTNGTQISVTITFRPSRSFALVPASCPSTLPANECAGYNIQVCTHALNRNLYNNQLSDAAGTWVNATASVVPGNQALVLSATAPTPGLRAIATSYGQVRHDFNPNP